MATAIAWLFPIAAPGIDDLDSTIISTCEKSPGSPSADFSITVRELAIIVELFVWMEEMPNWDFNLAILCCSTFRWWHTIYRKLQYNLPDPTEHTDFDLVETRLKSVRTFVKKSPNHNRIISTLAPITLLLHFRLRIEFGEEEIDWAELRNITDFFAVGPPSRIADPSLKGGRPQVIFIKGTSSLQLSVPWIIASTKLLQRGTSA